MTIRRENAYLIFDHPVQAHRLDDHVMHVALHYKILKMPEYRDNVEITNRVHQHINEHITCIKEMIEIS